jgi:hypothetical protein
MIILVLFPFDADPIPLMNLVLFFFPFFYNFRNSLSKAWTELKFQLDQKKKKKKKLLLLLILTKKSVRWIAMLKVDGIIIVRYSAGHHAYRTQVLDVPPQRKFLGREGISKCHEIFTMRLTWFKALHVVSYGVKRPRSRANICLDRTRSIPLQESRLMAWNGSGAFFLVQQKQSLPRKKKYLIRQERRMHARSCAPTWNEYRNI